MRILYFDCFSGISGDMTLASLVDAGADRDYIESELRKLNVSGYSLSWRRVNKSGISALKADVLLEEEARDHHHHDHDHAHDHHHHHDHDHVHEHEHGHHHGHDHEHDHAHHHNHGHQHEHEHDHEHGHHHHHRTYTDIVKLIKDAGLPPRATEISLSVFEKIGTAEAKIHGIPLEKVHFHEVGAVDSIVDIVGVALAIDNLNPDRIMSSPVPLGSGTIRIDHGLYPVPAPATLELMRGLPIAVSPHAVELTTPTGAGIIAALVDDFSSALPPITVEAIGYGAGTRELPKQPNVLRTVLGFSEQRLHMWPAPAVQPIPAEEHHGHQHHHSKQ